MGEIAAIQYNLFRSINGDEYSVAQVGHGGVVKISEHCPAGEGDRHWCDICYDNGACTRVFNVNLIMYAPTTE